MPCFATQFGRSPDWMMLCLCLCRSSTTRSATRDARIACRSWQTSRHDRGQLTDWEASSGVSHITGIGVWSAQGRDGQTCGADVRVRASNPLRQRQSASLSRSKEDRGATRRGRGQSKETGFKGGWSKRLLCRYNHGGRFVVVFASLLPKTHLMYCCPLCFMYFCS